MEKTVEAMEMNWHQKVKDLAKQQKVHLTEEEVETFAKQLPQIIHAFDALDQIDTSDVKPSYHALAITPSFRPDKIQPSTAPTENAKSQEKGYLKGPRILK